VSLTCGEGPVEYGFCVIALLRGNNGVRLINENKTRNKDVRYVQRVTGVSA